MSFRYKLVFGIVVIIMSSYIILAIITIKYVSNIYVEEVQTRVRLDLNSANDIYDNYPERIDNILQTISMQLSMDDTLDNESREELEIVFKRILDQRELDILIMTDTGGKVMLRANNPDIKGDDVSDISIIRKVKHEWKPVNGTIIINENILAREGTDLLKSAEVKIKSTPKSRREEKLMEKAGMFVSAAVPFNSLADNTKAGILFGGYLINNNNAIVDQIKSKVFQQQIYNGKDIGTATIFFDDVRIATNVKLEDGSRAIGSRLSWEVYDHVINNGKIWADRAFVVNDWYLTAYEPIKNPDGDIIGSLYVGLLEAPFKYPSRIIIMFFIITLSITTIACLAVIFVYTKMIMKPIDNIVEMSRKIMNGDLSARCKQKASGEMGLLCKTINQMAASVEKTKKEIQENAQMQIIQSEKLASVGRLAAGIAHEINNPLTGVLTFAHFLKDKYSDDPKDKEDIDIIIKETTKVRDIIRGLLNFARQSPSKKELTNVNEVIQESLKLIIGQKEFKNIQIVKNFDVNLPDLQADKNQLQQVLLNLILNSGESIKDEGIIKIETYAKEDDVQISISDNGCGIKKEDIDKIFDPFFTTKPIGRGTGLGLSVSYGIIKQHGGTIHCNSEVGVGTTFVISLPFKQ